MSNEQNIDDILRLLRETVDSESAEDSAEENTYEAQEHVSADELHETLKLKFSADGGNEAPEEKSPYDLDNDFLEEFAENSEAEATVEEPAEEAKEEFFEEETEETEEISDAVTLSESEEESVSEEKITEDIADEEIFAENIIFENDPVEENAAAEEIENTDNVFEEYENDEDVIDRQTEFFEGAEENVSISEDSEIPDPVYDDSDESEHFEADTEDYSDSSDDYEIGKDVTEAEETEIMTDEGSEFEVDGIIKESAEESVEESTEEEPIREAHRYNNMSFKAIIMDYGKPDPTPDEESEDAIPASESEDDTPDVSEILSDFATPAKEDKSDEDRAAREFMCKLGCADELDHIPIEAVREVLSEYGEQKVETAVNSNDEAVIKERRERFKKETVISAFRFVGCFIMTVILFFYDFLPTVDVRFMGIADYTNYPGAYVLFGTQLLLICAVILWRPMLDGVKKLATLYPNIYSMAAVIVGMTAAYDLIILIGGRYEHTSTPMFHFLSATVLTCVGAVELVQKIRRVKAYDVYVSDVARYNLSVDNDKNSIANKMYSGGFSKDKKVYIPTAATSPKGFSKAMSENGSFDSQIFSGFVFGAVVMSVIVGLIFMIAGIPQSAAVMMVSLFVLLPIGALLGMTLPYLAASFRLSKRGIALTGRRTVKKYADAKVLVFNDLHIFKKCDSKNVGFVAYDKRQTGDVIAALQILYSRIGGPMATSFDNLPEEMRAKRIRVRRIARNGIEALVDKKNVIIIGDIPFLRRYGVEFPNASGNATQSKNACIYVSLNGRASAMISAKYEIEPVFDMLIERLSAEGGHCVIETYDPVISTAFVASLRRNGSAPISVVHKNAADINTRAEERSTPCSDNGILAVSSRFKLIEAVVWCNRLRKAEKLTNIVTYCAMGAGFILTALLAAIGFIPASYQFILLLFGAVLTSAAVGITLYCIPGKNYFTVAALRNEQIMREERQKYLEEKEAEKLRRKNER